MTLERHAVRRLSAAALLLAMGVLLPQVFHLLGGAATGGTFLPMHIPVLMGGLLLGPHWGLALGVTCPLLSSLLTAMPPAARLPFMLVELAVYGLVAGLLSRRNCNLWVALLGAQIAGRLAYALVLWAGQGLFSLNFPPALTVWTALLTGLPGLVVQWVFVPSLVLLTRRVVSLAPGH